MERVFILPLFMSICNDDIYTHEDFLPRIDMTAELQYGLARLAWTAYLE